MMLTLFFLFLLFQAEVRIPPPVAPMPKHRSRCVACGCPKVCCVRNFVFLWIVIFILIQAGPLAVLVLDLLSMNVEGTTISRFVSLSYFRQPTKLREGNVFSRVCLSVCSHLLASGRLAFD